MEKEQQFYILRPDGTINFLNLAFYTALHHQDWFNNPQNQEKIKNYEKVFSRPFKLADIEVLEIKHKVKLPFEFKEYITKISKEIFLGDYPVIIKYEDIENALESKLFDINETNMIKIGEYENNEGDYIFLGKNKNFGSIWRKQHNEWNLTYASFSEYILRPFS